MTLQPIPDCIAEQIREEALEQGWSQVVQDCDLYLHGDFDEMMAALPRLHLALEAA